MAPELAALARRWKVVEREVGTGAIEIWANPHVGGWTAQVIESRREPRFIVRAAGEFWSVNRPTIVRAVNDLTRLIEATAGKRERRDS
jgi:hypothetical protein